MLLAVAGVLLTACQGPEVASRPEVYPQVEVRYDRALRKALHEVPDSRPVSVSLRQAPGPEPVWRVRVATREGTVHRVRLDAVRGRLLGTAVPAGQSAADKARTASMADAAGILPEEAVEKAAPAAADPHFGKVTDVRLGHNREQRLVWSVTVAEIRPGLTHTHQVDAITSEVLSRSTGGPTTAPAPPSEPARPTAP